MHKKIRNPLWQKAFAFLMRVWASFIAWNRASDRAEYYRPRHSAGAIKRLHKTNGSAVWSDSDDSGALPIFVRAGLIFTGTKVLKVEYTRAHA